MPELGELKVETLMPLGAIDVSRQVMPQYRNSETGDTGELGELSKKPGAMWHATWVQGEPWYVRMEDGSVREVRPEGES